MAKVAPIDALEPSPSLAELYAQTPPVRADRLLERLALEAHVRFNLCGLLLLIGHLTCFLCVVDYLLPAEEASSAHRRLEVVFGLSKAKDVQTAADMYDFMTEFSTGHTSLQALEPSQWCEERFYSLQWNAAASKPVAVCNRPGGGQLDLGNLSSINCSDDNAALSTSLNLTTTCDARASTVCDTADAALCPVTCNICPPFTYRRMRQFIGPQLVVMPVIVSQSRFETKVCSGFANRYQDQKPNTRQFFQPPLDGPRNGDLRKCVDRSRKMSRDYGIELPCPVNASWSCPTGSFQDTLRQTYRDETVYSKVFLTPSQDIAKMKAIDWLDVQTAEVSVSALAYTEGIEIFTAVTVHFEVDEAGGIETKVRLNSWKELDDEAQGHFIAAAVCSAVLALVGMVQMLRQMTTIAHVTAKATISLFTRFVTVVMALGALAWKLKAHSIQKLYEEALDTMASITDLTSEAGQTEVFNKWAQINVEIEDISKEFDNIQVVLFAVVIVQLVQIAVHLSCHPGTSVFAATMEKALERLVHLALLFLPLFFFFGYVTFWMFGFELEDFSTFGKALTTQLRMVYGDFIEVPGAAALTGSDSAMYWLHAVVFMTGAFVFLRFLMLAVIMDAFLEVQKSRPATAYSAPYDLFDALRSRLRFLRGNHSGFCNALTNQSSDGWPSPDSVIAYLRNASDPDGVHGQVVDNVVAAQKIGDKTVMTAGMLRELFGNPRHKVDPAEEFLKFYAHKLPHEEPEGPPNLFAATLTPSGAVESELRQAAFAMDEPGANFAQLDPNLIAQRVVAEITMRLAEKSPQNVDRFVTIGRLSCVISREFRKCGLIQ